MPINGLGSPPNLENDYQQAGRAGLGSERPVRLVLVIALTTGGRGRTKVVDGADISLAGRQLNVFVSCCVINRKRTHRNTDNPQGKGYSFPEHQGPVSRVVAGNPDMKGRPIRGVAGYVGGTRHVIAASQRWEE